VGFGLPDLFQESIVRKLPLEGHTANHFRKKTIVIEKIRNIGKL
jgi:hypothetical protein